jgi:hypothetical protein
MRRLLLALLLAGACNYGNVVSLTPTRYPARPKEHPVRLYSVRLPKCPFEELGILNVSSGVTWFGLESVSAALLDRVRELGGDALVGFRYVDNHNTMSGTVIRFHQDDCQE